MAWLHAMVPGAEEIDLFEELDAARELQEWVELRHVQGVVELLTELFDGQEPTVDEVLNALLRRGLLPKPGEADRGGPERREPARGDQTRGAADDGQTGAVADGPAAGGERASAAVSEGQAAAVIAHLLGAHPVGEAGSDGGAEAGDADPCGDRPRPADPADD